MNTIVMRNIDVDPELFVALSSIMSEQVTGDDTQLFLFHQRKPSLTDIAQRSHLVDLAKIQIDQLQDHSAKISSVHLIDCCSEQKHPHSDFSVISDITTLLSNTLGPETTADVVLLDFHAPEDGLNELTDNDITVRSLSDPSVNEDLLTQLSELIDDTAPGLHPTALMLSEDDINSFLGIILEETAKANLGFDNQVQR